VVGDGERIAVPPIAELELALEVGTPQIIGCGALGERRAARAVAGPAEPGVYRFKTNLSMEGRWQLSLGAKVQGETGTVQSKLVLKAVR
jgi:hypothetical protein